MAKQKPDIPTKAEQDVKDNVYDPPHDGPATRGTLLGRSRTEAEKHDRKVYHQVRERAKKRNK